jgi:hypothetical protein
MATESDFKKITATESYFINQFNQNRPQNQINATRRALRNPITFVEAIISRCRHAISMGIFPYMAEVLTYLSRGGSHSTRNLHHNKRQSSQSSSPKINFVLFCPYYGLHMPSQVELLGSKCQTSGIYSKRAKQATKMTTPRLACFLKNYLAFLRPAADRTISILLWVVSRSRSYGFLWADSIIQKNVRKDDPTPAFSPVSSQKRLTALVEVHWARRVQAPMPQASGPNSQENHIY